MATSTESKEGINDNEATANYGKIKVGSSQHNTKLIILPESNMEVSPIAVNKQDSQWNDTFSVKVEQNKLFVTRIDCKTGWGQNLILQATKVTKRGVNVGISLIGQWKCLVFINSKYWGCHHIHCFKHSSQGVIEAQLIGTQNPGKKYTVSKNKSNYIGVKKGDCVTLTYKDSGGKYTASITLQINDYSMDGTWHDSSHQSG
eukprot:UN03176